MESRAGAARGALWLAFGGLLLVLGTAEGAGPWRRREDKTKCPRVKGIRDFDVAQVCMMLPLCPLLLTRDFAEFLLCETREYNLWF